MEQRVSIITLGVTDLDRSLRFYRDGLGFPTTRKADAGIIFFQTSGVCLALYPYTALAKDVSDEFLVAKSRFTGITLMERKARRRQKPPTAPGAIEPGW